MNVEEGPFNPGRRQALRVLGAMVPLALVGAAAIASPAAIAVAKKAAPESVGYQTAPKDDQSCARCANFLAKSNSCNLVEGLVSPKGWCKLWTKKV